ncbi:MAG: hypothetical protein NTW86_32775 [Candidatus Sumerlaeota bacterium]|nr:hypothetical protein [Candidatus Sumerlaeota bacterium]
MRNTLARIASLLIVILAPSSAVWAQPFLPPGVLNPGATSDSGIDIHVSHVYGPNGTAHAVWTSNGNYTGTAGTDADIYYSSNSGGGWSAPILVNNFGTSDTGVDDMPKLAIDSTGVLHCVWHSDSTYAGTGTDRDIFYSRNTGATWSAAELVNDGVADNFSATNDDGTPALALRQNGDVVVVWASDYPNPAGGPFVGVGADGDIQYAIRTGSGWTPAAPLTNFFASDTGNDAGPPALATEADGDIVAVWSTNDPLRVFNGKGNDYDIVYSILPLSGSWIDPTEVSALEHSDTGKDSCPSVATIGSGENAEIHVVWMSQENYLGSGTDWDIFHTVISGIQTIPTMNPTYLANSTAKNDGAADDQYPVLCVEPGGVLHCVWQSNYNLGGQTGTDIDVFHSLNATRGGEWSPMELLGLNGFFDNPGDDDEMPSMAMTPDGLLSAVWQSSDDYGGTIGNDYDILNAIGDSKRFSRPGWVNATATADGPNLGTDFDQTPRLAVDPNGVMHAIWSSTYAGLAGGLAGGDGDIYHATLGAGGWSAPELVNTNGTADTGSDSWADLGIDAFGTRYAVWASNENLGGTLGNDFDILFSMNVGAGWSFPVPVNSNAATDTKDDFTPRIAVAPNGTVHCVWASDFDTVNFRSNISYAVRGASAWSATEYVDAVIATPPQGWNFLPDLALDYTGIPHVVWQSNVNYNGAGADDDIFYSSRAGGAWSAPQFVNDAGSDGADDWDPTIARAPDGSLHVVWDADLNVQGAGTDRDLFISTKNGGAWTAPQLLLAQGATDALPDQDPRIAFAPNGDLHVVWRGQQNLWGAGTDTDIYYSRIAWGTTLPSSRSTYLANSSAFGDGLLSDELPWVALDREGRVHCAWESYDPLGGAVGDDLDALHGWMNSPNRSIAGAPYTDLAWDNGAGILHLLWVNYAKPPAQYLGFAWDIYAGQWVLGGWNDTLWHPYPYGDFQGDLAVTRSGGYHAWISSQYGDGTWFACANPWTGIVYSGTPHTPANVSASDVGTLKARVQWKTDIYGTWHYQIIAFKLGTGWVNTTGPSGNAMWQFIAYPSTAFLNGRVDLTVPSAGDYVFYIRGAGWWPPYPTGAYGITAAAHVN